MVEGIISFNRTSITHDNFSVSKIKYIIYKVQDYRVLYNNMVLPVLYNRWHIAHMWKALALLHHFTKKGDLVP
jgi:hypothetical protein